MGLGPIRLCPIGVGPIGLRPIDLSLIGVGPIGVGPVLRHIGLCLRQTGLNYKAAPEGSYSFPNETYALRLLRLKSL